MVLVKIFTIFNDFIFSGSTEVIALLLNWLKKELLKKESLRWMYKGLNSFSKYSYNCEF